MCLSPLPRPAEVAAALLACTNPVGFDFIECAEQEGLGPVIALQLNAAIIAHPNCAQKLGTLRATLLALAARHELAHRARVVVLQQLSSELAKANLRHLYLKGVGVALLAYPNPSLRAMRDVDLLVAEADLERVAKVMRACGFSDERRAPEGCHEVYSLAREHAGMKIRIDVHRRLGLFDLPSYKRVEDQTLEALWEQRQPLRFGDDGRATAFAPSFPSLVRLVLRHGFMLGLYEPTRWVSVLDVVALAETLAARPDVLKDLREDFHTWKAIVALLREQPVSGAVREAFGVGGHKAQAEAPKLGYHGSFCAGEPAMFFGEWTGPLKTKLVPWWRATFAPEALWLALRYPLARFRRANFWLELLNVAYVRYRLHRNPRR